MRVTLRDRVRRILSDGRWHTGLDLCRECGKQFGTGLTAKLRDLRKPEHGGHVIESRRNEELSRLEKCNVWEYRMILGVEQGAHDALPVDATGQGLLMASIDDPAGHY